MSTNTPATTVRTVKILQVGAASAYAGQRYSGEVRARVETTLGFRVGGKLVERRVDVGATVKAGEALARLDPADLALTATQAEANRTLADAEVKRARELREKNFISQAALDAKETTATAATAQAQLSQRQSGYATLAADTPGVIAAVLAEPGQVLAAGQGVFRVARAGEREVAIAIPEGQVAGLQVGATGTVTLWGVAGRTYRGRLREIAPMADAATRTFAARVSILDADVAVALGMTATASFAAASAAPLVVPLAALLQQGDQPAVWIVGKDDTLSLRPVTVTRYGDAGAEIGAGLAVGETFVAAGAFLLTAGEKVHPVQ